ncbi:MAG: hypothetical protein GY869_03795, partial [Planctomycetes bacterium]|nr:hypothetical protein [Planctomycetota bacterium]
LYRDANNNGQFDAAVDVHVTLAEAPVFVANEANLIPLDTQDIESIESPDKPDYFVVIHISPGASPGDDFRFKIPEYGVGFTDGTASGQTRRTAELIIIDDASLPTDHIYTYRSSFLMLFGDTFNDGFPVYFTVTDYFTFNGIDSVLVGDATSWNGDEYTDYIYVAVDDNGSEGAGSDLIAGDGIFTGVFYLRNDNGTPGINTNDATDQIDVPDGGYVVINAN